MVEGCSSCLDQEGELDVVGAMGLVRSTSWGLLGEPVVRVVRARVPEGGLRGALFPGGVVGEDDREYVNNDSQLVCMWCWILAASV